MARCAAAKEKGNPETNFMAPGGGLTVPDKRLPAVLIDTQNPTRKCHMEHHKYRTGRILEQCRQSIELGPATSGAKTCGGVGRPEAMYIGLVARMMMLFRNTRTWPTLDLGLRT